MSLRPQWKDPGAVLRGYGLADHPQMIVAYDPGRLDWTDRGTSSAVAYLRGDRLELELIRQGGAQVLADSHFDVVLIEDFKAQGHRAGADQIETAKAVGWLYAAVRGQHIELVSRRSVIDHFGARTSKRGADAVVRAAVMERFGVTSRTVRSATGPIIQATGHDWQALGLLIAWVEWTTGRKVRGVSK